MLGLDGSNEGCSIDGSKESVRLGLKGAGPGAQQAWSEELAQVRKSQIGKLRSGELRVAWIGSLGPVRTKTAV